MPTQEAMPTAGAVRPRVRVVRRPALPRRLRSANWARLLSTGAPTRRELLAFGGILVLLGALAFASHIRHGGFIMDDWSNAAQTRYLASCCGPGVEPAGAGFLGQFHVLLHDGPAAYHLGLPVLVPIVEFIFGVHVHLYLALAVLFGVAMSLAAYVLLRKMSLAPLHAGVICALVLLFPWSDSTRLWTMASYNQVAVVVWLLGLFVALHGMRSSRRWQEVAWHALALAIYVLAVFTYELAAGGVIISALFYLRRTSWRGALVRFVPDALVAYLALSYVKAHTAPRAVEPLHGALKHLNLIADQSLTLFARSTFPVGQPQRNLIDALLVLAFAAGGVAWAAAPKGAPVRATMRRWLAVAGAGIVTVFAGYITLVPATYGQPLDNGIENRVNMISAFGYVAVAYAAAMIVGTLIVRRRSWSPAYAPAVALVLAVVMTGGYLHKLDKDKTAYDASYAEQQQVLGAVGKTLGPHPRHGAIVYAFNYPSFTAPGVPVFAWIWDFNQALKIQFQDPSLGGYPILPATTWSCKKDRMYPNSPFGTNEGEWGPYGNSYFVDVGRGVSQRIDSRAECQSATQSFQPGPVKAGTDCTLIGGGPATRLWWACGTKPKGA